MRTTKSLRVGGLVAAIAVGALGFLIAGASGATGAPSGQAAGAKNATIKMQTKGKDLVFAGSSRVKSGGNLKIVNATDIREVGPHSFTLVKKGSLPRDKSAIKDCERIKSDVCEAIVKAHKADPKTGEVKKPLVDVGKTGWDKSFGKKGDSVFAFDKGTADSRKVRARPGKTLHYLCIVHPFMQGKIKVVK